MADAKITELDALTAPAAADLLAIVDDVAGTPITKKIVLSDVLTYLTTTKARAYLTTTAQTITKETRTKITLNAESYDIGGNFDHATSYGFTAPVTGYYLVTASLKYASPAADNFYIIWIYKNTDTMLTSSWAHASMTSAVSASVSDILYLTANDVVDMQTQQNTAGDETVSAGEQETFMAIHLLSI